MVKFNNDSKYMALIVKSFKIDPKNRTKRFPTLRALNRREASRKPTIGKDRCKICNDIYKHKPHLDHCHYTGTTRDYLCIRCNTGLGKFFDSSALLKKCMNYIDKHDPRFEMIKTSMLENAKSNGGIVWSSEW
jgi:hypothetical protein